MHRFHVLPEVVHARESFAAQRAGHVLRVVEVHEFDVAPRVVCLLALVFAQRAPEPCSEKKIKMFFLFNYLKVDGNEKRGGSGRRQQISPSLALWRSRANSNLNVSFLCTLHNLFPLPLATAQFIGNVSTNRRSAANFFTFLYIGADVPYSYLE